MGKQDILGPSCACSGAINVKNIRIHDAQGGRERHALPGDINLDGGPSTDERRWKKMLFVASLLGTDRLWALAFFSQGGKKTTRTDSF